MLDLGLRRNDPLRSLLDGEPEDVIRTGSLEEKVRLLVVRDLMRLGWNARFEPDRVLITPPASYDKHAIRASMQVRRHEAIRRHWPWIAGHMESARANLASGHLVWNSPIEPVIEVCRTQQQRDVFRLFRFYWSSPYSEYVGRRIKLLIRDQALPGKPLVGIAALGSSIVHIPSRDAWIGWDKRTRTDNIVYAMDAYVLGALPPYNYLLGGKLVSYIIASNEVRGIYRRKYQGVLTNQRGREAHDLACIFTTSLYGPSSQYNRVRYQGRLLYIPIGPTKGFGTLHLTDETFEAMRDLLRSRGVEVTNRFGDGPSWRMRVIRSAAEQLGFDSDSLLRHSFQRQVYAVPLASNFREFLTGKRSALDYYDYPLDALVEHWRTRWLRQRRTNLRIRQSVHAFEPEQFAIT